MSSTTSDDKADEIEPIQKEDSETADEAEDDIPITHARDEGPDRKRRKLSTNERARQVERERRMERYAKERIREMEPGPSRSASKRGDSRSSRRTNASREPSRSRSNDRSRSNRSRSKSPAVGQIMPSRVGKRLRRRPQRWEGERREIPKATRVVLGQATRGREVEGGNAAVGRESDNEPTVSAQSVLYEGECPALENPVWDMRSAVRKCRSMTTRRAVVDSFHTWQLQAVSRQAAQQKALHVFLKRKLRRRTGRAPDIDRLEEEALRNARTATVKTGSNAGGGKQTETFTALEDEAEDIVPARIRLPLEAYLPRRVKANKTAMFPEELVEIERVKPHLPGSLSEITEVTDGGRQVWMRFPTVTATSSLNKQRKVFQNGQK